MSAVADEKRIKFLLLGEDKSASKTLEGVGKKADKTGGLLGKMGGSLKGGLIGIASSIAIGEVVDFGNAAVEAFRDAEKSQRSLADAYKRFPALQDVSITKMREQASAIQAKVGADADDIAASQAVLARYKLTGDQLQRMTPLLVDYAKRTGKDLPAAAGALGKSLMGSSRLSKELGFSFKASKDPAKNFEQVMAGLRKTVGGYADKEASSAAGKTEIMRARLGDLQESIGGKLEPIMNRLLGVGMKVLDWLDANPAVIEGASAAFDGLVGVIEWLAGILGAVLQPVLVGNIRLFAMITGAVADMLDALSMVPRFEWAKGAADTLRKVATGANAAADGIADIGKQKVMVKTDQAQKNITNLKSKIASVKGKIVEAKAKGNTKEVDRLQAKLNKLERTYNAKVRASMSGSGTITVRQSSPTRFTMRAFRQGGRPKVGELAMFHRDEIWVPDHSGTVISQAKSRSMMGNGPGPFGGGGAITILVAGDTDPDAAARRIERILTKRKKRFGKLGFE